MDRYDQLEKLRQLHVQGVLTDAEFESEKRRVLDGGVAADPPPPSSGTQAAPGAASTDGRMIVWVLGTAVLFLTAIVVWALMRVGSSGAGATNSANVAQTFKEAPPPVVANTAAPVVPPPPPPTPPPPPAPTAADWVGQYNGPFDGGRGSVLISRASQSQLYVAIDVVDAGCVGEVTFSARVPSGNRLVLTKMSEDGDQCRVTIDRNGRTLTLRENNCLYYHGFRCAFEGRATR